MVLRLMRQLAQVLVVAAVCFGKNTHCSVSGRRRKGRENGEGIGERKKETNNNNNR